MNNPTYTTLSSQTNSVNSLVESGKPTEMWLSDEQGQVYVTIDTSQAVFPEVQTTMSFIDVKDSLNWGSQSLLQPIELPTEPVAASDVLSTKLDTLAHAASTQLPMNELQPVTVQPPQNTPLPPSNLVQLPQHPDPSVIGLANGIIEMSTSSGANRLLCGDCSVGFESADVFFKHWLDNHCKLENDQTSSNMPLQQCPTCKHIFVMGTAKALEHNQRCGLDKAKMNSAIQKRKQHENEENVQPTVKLPKTAKRPPNAVSCGTCSLNLKTITSFFLHWLEAHDQITDILEQVWQCGVCIPSKLFPDVAGLRDHFHQAKHVPSDPILPCSIKGCASKFAADEGLAEHLNMHSQDSNPKTLNRCSKCPKIFQNGLLNHFFSEHATLCDLCSCQVHKEEMDDHLSNFHRFERVWNRQTNLEKIAASDAQMGKPAAQVTPSSHTRRLVENSSSTLTVIPSNPSGNPITTPTDPPSSLLDSVVKSSQPSPSTASVPPPPTPAPSAASAMKCKACSLFFTSEKLLEKHYFANHEFKCKFCDKTMDKDEYGDHLRVHLASERKRGVPKK
ncbi:hypothetical protein TCAL_07550 [Tigriopus californicus]|uniref:C2H2-type domain-containing protein n=1 Tax=Tigriopus californicus TaxID=6832 RepID=A0A553PP36_TIGCA|nr:zinc finger protein 628-like [Tigriopus californicus]TRY79447.1 hypothetical protein TCAL_07550 [Tigriopus californicus]|eukprot:TCALIF_07550-PB protein Name:"Protein of unknown function" AED:0.01 eAED:0.01 QI:769/1/0.66/1/1/0.66/3/0/560